MDRQAREVLNILHSHQIDYWLDSGTLLGLMRDGSLMAHDEDIDLGVWDREEPKVRGLFPLMQKAGYILYTASYNGEYFKYNFIPKDKSLRKVDINIFREFGKYAWCPMYYFKVNPKKKNSGRLESAFLSGIKGGTRNLWKRVTARFPFHVEINAFPWRPFLNIGTWWIPVDYFQKTCYNDDLGAVIPKNWEDYLKFRYDRWQEQPAEWVFYRDDGGIRHIQPPQVPGQTPGVSRRLSR